MVRKALDLEGKRFGRLVAIESTYNGKNRIWTCTCDCGNKITVQASHLNLGHTKSCGCLHPDVITKHGAAKFYTHTKEYGSWLSMKQRCLNKNDPAFRYYGERGITICDRWVNSFENFYEDMGQIPSPKHSIDRINPNGNYEPSNCRWADIDTQKRNKRNSKIITFNGETLTLTEHAAKQGINSGTVWVRLFKLGWGIERALTEKSRRSK